MVGDEATVDGDTERAHLYIKCLLVQLMGSKKSDVCRVGR